MMTQVTNGWRGWMYLFGGDPLIAGFFALAVVLFIGGTLWLRFADE